MMICRRSSFFSFKANSFGFKLAALSRTAAKAADTAASNSSGEEKPYSV